MYALKKKSRVYHNGDLKASMIQAALDLVRKRGPRGFTLNEASRTAGVSVSAPYNHFKDKDALLIEIVLPGNHTLETELRIAAESKETPVEQLVAVFLPYIEFATLHPELFSVMFQSGMDKSPYPMFTLRLEEHLQWPETWLLRSSRRRPPLKSLRSRSGRWLTDLRRSPRTGLSPESQAGNEMNQPKRSQGTSSRERGLIELWIESGEDETRRSPSTPVG